MASPEEVAAMICAHDRHGRVKGIAPKELRTYNGVIYHSKAEAKYAFELDRQKSAGIIHAWEGQIKLPIQVNGIHICYCIVDFRIKRMPDSEWEYIELKGWESAEWRLKRKLLLAIYGREFKYQVIKV